MASYALWDDERSLPFHDVIVHFVARDVPQPPPMAHYFTPIQPVSGSQMEEDALHTTVLSPRADFKQWTAFEIRLRVNQLHTSSLIFELAHDDFPRFGDNAGNDNSQLETAAIAMVDAERDRNSLFRETRYLPTFCSISETAKLRATRGNSSRKWKHFASTCAAIIVDPDLCLTANMLKSDAYTGLSSGGVMQGPDF